MSLRFICELCISVVLFNAQSRHFAWINNTAVYLLLLKEVSKAPSFWQAEHSCYKHLHMGFDKHKFSFLFGKYLRMELRGHRGRVCSTLQETVLQSGHTVLHSCQPCRVRASRSASFFQHMHLVGPFFLFAIRKMCIRAFYCF